MNDIRPVFITGAPRSGTTLLASMISSRNDSVALPEMHYVHKLLELNLLLNKTDKDSIYKVMQGSTKFIDLGLVATENELKNLIGEGNEKELIFRIINEYNKKYGNKNYKYWVEHSPQNSFHFNTLMYFFPNAKFVHIARDGRAVYNSTKETDWGYKDVVTGANNWSTIIKHNLLLESIFPDKFCTIKYEDLTTNPKSTMKELCEFLEMEYDESMLNNDGVIKQSFAKYHKSVKEKANISSQNKWKYELKQAEIEYFTTENKKYLCLLGYATKGIQKKTYSSFKKIIIKIAGKIKTIYFTKKSKKRFAKVYLKYPDFKQ
ncbi:MAG: sulfotransferase [gamma proteobacterium symbiont of Bathyaustriella thionipta]|nr:sulfotransferase [gamma proteobacterium symbiont of Bathyaustriella thionipta]MCU7958105.1 sulfotransferase [gamma proteobacterium symbiont of Bathyaustriella thionipta]MCU7968398.1 sulfotransferase [gamma proteobacterium symbiont of Bathyaustriella thionipta]